MKVYIVVERRSDESVEIHAVRSSAKKAQEWIEEQDSPPSRFEVEDWIVK
jgi:hypothetical protein